MSDTVYVVVLPSGRLAKIAEPTLESTWEVTEQAGMRAGGTFNQAKLALEIDKELVRVHLRAITRTAVPWQFVQKDGQATTDIDFDAMVQAARDGAGGGFRPVSYKDLISEGELSLLTLFNRERRDFESLVAQINVLSAGQRDPKAPPAAALIGRRVIELST